MKITKKANKKTKGYLKNIFKKKLINFRNIFKKALKKSLKEQFQIWLIFQ